jgi:hypothetical protein
MKNAKIGMLLVWLWSNGMSTTVPRNATDQHNPRQLNTSHFAPASGAGSRQYNFCANQRTGVKTEIHNVFFI